MAKDKERIHLDVDDEEMLASFSIGDKVTVMIRGTVKGMSAPRKYDDESETFPGDVSIEVDERTIKKGRNVFSELSEDDEEDM